MRGIAVIHTDISTTTCLSRANMVKKFEKAVALSVSALQPVHCTKAGHIVSTIVVEADTFV